MVGWRFRIGRVSTVALLAALAAAPALHAAQEDTNSLVNDAKARIAKGDFKGAEIQLRNAVRANPSDPENHLALADLYLKVGNLPDAEAEARLARTDKGDPNRVDPLLAEALLQQGKFSELFRDVPPEKRENKAESEVRRALGLAHLTLREMDEAEPLLKASEQLDPSAAAPKAAMAQLLLSKNDIAGAQDEIAAATAIAPDDPTVLRDSALVLLAQGNADGALKTLNNLILAYPDNIGARGLRANLLIGADKLDDAQADLTYALKLSPNHPGLIYLQALLLARQNKPQEADTQLSSISTAFNDIPSGYYLQGLVKYELGQYQQATLDLSKYIARVPNATAAKRLLALIAMRQRDYATAINVLKPVVDSDPSDADSMEELAQAYLAVGNRRGDALALYQRLASLRPNDARAAVALDMVKIETGQIDQGLDELDKMTRSAEGGATAGPALVMSDLRLGHVDAAAQAAQALIARNPRDLMAQSLLGIVLMVEKKYADAATTFKAIVDKDRSLLGAQRGLAEADVSLGKLDDAKAVLQGLLQQQPNSVADEVTLAGIYVRQKDFSEAETLLRKAQQDAATDPTPGLALLQMYADQKGWDKAQSYASQLELQFPGQPRVVSAVAAMHAAAGNAKGAAAEYQRLVQVMPKDPQILLRYAAYQAKAGDQAGARATLEQAHLANPKNFAVMSQLASFDFDSGGLDKSLATARSFASDQQLASDLISAALYERANRLSDAVAVLTAAMKRNPQLPVVLELAGDLFNEGEHGPAIETLRGWIKDHPGDFESQLVLGDLYERQSDDAAALQVYETAYKDNPSSWVLANNLAGLYARKGDPRARALGEQAYYLSPTPGTADTYGWALVETGDAGDGLPLLHEAAVDLPDNATVLYHYAVALKESGKLDEARQVLQKAIASGATFDDENAAKKLLEQLQRG